MKNLIAPSVIFVVGLHCLVAQAQSIDAPQISQNETNVADKAKFVSQLFPSYVKPGEAFKAIVQYRNTGDTTWRGSDKVVYLQPVSDKANLAWRITPILLDKETNVQPNETATFSFNLTAPTVRGDYTLRWEIALKDKGTISDASPDNLIHVGKQPAVDVSAREKNAIFVNSSVNLTMTVGDEQSVILQFKNTGKSTWSSSTVGLIASAHNNNLLWFIDQVPYSQGETTPPGEIYAFRFSVRAPAEPGEYPFQWQMYDMNAQQPFGEMSEAIKITVIAR